MLGLSRDLNARNLAGLAEEGGRRLRTPEAAKYLGVGESTLEKWRCTGTGPEFERVGVRIVVYRIAALEAFLAERRAMSTSEPPVSPKPRGLHRQAPLKSQRNGKRQGGC